MFSLCLCSSSGYLDKVASSPAVLTQNVWIQSLLVGKQPQHLDWDVGVHFTAFNFITSYFLMGL